MLECSACITMEVFLLQLQKEFSNPQTAVQHGYGPTQAYVQQILFLLDLIKMDIYMPVLQITVYSGAMNKLQQSMKLVIFLHVLMPCFRTTPIPLIPQQQLG